MIPAFSCWQDFLAMGGYAFYVWLAVGFTLFPLVALLLYSLFQYRRVSADIRHFLAREQRIPIEKTHCSALITGIKEP